MIPRMVRIVGVKTPAMVPNRALLDCPVADPDGVTLGLSSLLLVPFYSPIIKRINVGISD